jgi:hypothetical protein
MKIFRIITLIVSILLYCSCSSSTDDIIPEQPAEQEDVFYAHYEVTCSSNDPNSTKEINAITESGNIIVKLPHEKVTKWEATFGPFKKGQNTGFSCHSEGENDGSIFNARIDIKKNNEPFVLKEYKQGNYILLGYYVN